MSITLNLSDTDLSFLAELLEREQKNLLIEIRHTDAAAYRDVLRQRLTALDSILDEVEQAAPAGHSGRRVE